MSFSSVMRQVHRWVSFVFSLLVGAIFVGMAVGTPPEWVFMLPLPPLFVLIPTGLYLFVLPYVAKTPKLPVAE